MRGANFSYVDVESDFLNALSTNLRSEILLRSTIVTLVLGQKIFSNRDSTSHVYFPLSAVISVQAETSDGSAFEVYEIGKEGILGLPLFLSDLTPPQVAIVCASGQALRTNTAFLLEQFACDQEFAAHLFSFMNLVVNSVSQSAICSRLHHADQRLCRWLLSITDRTITNQIFVTHELMANVLGVTREFVTFTLRNLRKQGLIECARGLVIVTDTKELENHSCECYHVTKKELAKFNEYRKIAATQLFT